MRMFFVAAFALTAVTLAASGCSAPVDPTVNRQDPNAQALNYPAGPYGYQEGSVVDDYRFLGQVPVNGDFTGVAVNPLLLDSFHADATTKYLLIDGAANWCYYCNQEAPDIAKLAASYMGKGLQVLTVLAEGPTVGVPSTPDDITAWVKKHNVQEEDMAIDPAERLFQFAPASAFPLHILIDTTTMKIQWLCVGGQGACDPTQAVGDLLPSS